MRNLWSILIGLCLTAAAVAQGTTPAPAPSTPATTTPAAQANTTTPDNAAASAFTGNTDIMVGMSGLWFPSQTVYGQSLTTTDSGGFAASARLHLTPWNSFEFQFTDSRQSHNYYPSWSANAQARELIINYVATLPTDSRIQPFLLAGAGVISFGLDTDVTGNYVTTGTTLTSQTKLAVDYGGGADYHLMGHFKARAEFRIVEYKAPDFGATNVNDLRLDNWSMALEPTLGLIYNF